MKARVNWRGSPLIGQPWDGKDVMHSMVKPFYDDRYKLQAVFPCALGRPVVLNKSAAFDVCTSADRDSFFDNWRAIKHNIVNHWVDINDPAGAFGFALMSDQTTSYVFGPDDPLGLVLAYAGQGLWNRTYSVSGVTEVRYAIEPHGGAWDRARLWGEDSQWNEPMLAQMMPGGAVEQAWSKPLVQTSPGNYVTAMFMDHSALILRLFNAEGGVSEQTVTLGFIPSEASVIELDGRQVAVLAINRMAQGGAAVKLSMPRFGVRTLRFAGIAKPST